MSEIEITEIVDLIDADRITGSGDPPDDLEAWCERAEAWLTEPEPATTEILYFDIVRAAGARPLYQAMVEGGELFVLDYVSDTYTRHHDLTAEEQAEIVSRARARKAAHGCLGQNLGCVVWSRAA